MSTDDPFERPSEDVPRDPTVPAPKEPRLRAGIVWLGILVGMVALVVIGFALSPLTGSAYGAPVFIAIAAVVALGIRLVRSQDRRTRSWGMGLLLAAPAALVAAPVLGFVACIIYSRSSGA